MKALEKIGLSSLKQKYYFSLFLIFLNLFFMWLFTKINLRGDPAFYTWEFLYVFLFVIYLIDVESLRKEAKVKYNTFLKIIVPEIFSAINYVLLIIMYIPIKFCNSKKWTIISIDLYVIVLLITIIIYLILDLFPYSYNQEYESDKIGSLLYRLSEENCDLNDISSIILNSRELEILIKPQFIDNKKINSSTIIDNLRWLKKKHEESFLKLEAIIRIRTESRIWSVVSVLGTVTTLLITLISKNFFNDLITSITSNSSVNEFKIIGESVFIAVPIIVIWFFFKYGRQEANKEFYYEIQEYIEESQTPPFFNRYA